MSENTSDIFDNFAVSEYSRAQAIEDGELIDLTTFMVENDMKVFKHPTACSRAVWDAVIDWDGDSTQSVQGRLWDVLNNALIAIKNNHDPSSQVVEFDTVTRDQHGERSFHELKVHIGPGDSPEPVITIMFSAEN